VTEPFRPDWGKPPTNDSLDLFGVKTSILLLQQSQDAQTKMIERIDSGMASVIETKVGLQNVEARVKDLEVRIDKEFDKTVIKSGPIRIRALEIVVWGSVALPFLALFVNSIAPHVMSAMTTHLLALFH
jgi:hypothetical protein